MSSLSRKNIFHIFTWHCSESISYKTIILWLAGSCHNLFPWPLKHFTPRHSVPDNIKDSNWHTHTAHMSPSQNTNLSYANDTLQWWAMHWTGWERLVSWQTFLEADVNVLSQNMLNMMLRTKIWTPWTKWELICLDEGGPQLADLEVKIITPEVEIPQVWSKKKRWEVDQDAFVARLWKQY